MWFANKKTTDSWSIPSDFNIFFTLALYELFDGPVDTWQVRTMNVRTILQEIVDVVGVCGEYEPYAYHLPYILREAQAIAQRDPIVGQHFPFVVEYLKPFCHHDPRDIDRANLEKVAKIILGYLNDYPDLIVAQVRKLIVNPAAKEKQELTRLAMALATDVRSCGYSDWFLTKSLAVLTDPSEPDFGRRFEALLGQWNGKQRQFLCTFQVAAPSQIDELLPKQGFAISMSDADLGSENTTRSNFFRAAGDEKARFASITVSAIDPIAARRQAERTLMSAFAAMNIYMPRRKLHLGKPEVLVEDTRGDGSWIISAKDTERFGLQDTSNPGDRAGAFVSVSRKLQKIDADQLDASTQYHRLALLAPTEEAKLVNLWIALECVTRRSGNSPIETACRYVAPTVAIRNASKHVGALAYYLSRHCQGERKKVLVSRLPRSTTKRIDPADLLAALCNKDETLAQHICSSVDNPLIRYRVFQLRTRAFADAATLASNVEAHRKNIEWQLRRIYRARNEVIHRAASAPWISSLIPHLHTYLLHTVQRVVHDLERVDGIWGIPEALEHRARLFEHYTTSLRSTDGYRMRRRSVLEPVELLLGEKDSEEATWPAPETAGQKAASVMSTTQEATRLHAEK